MKSLKLGICGLGTVGSGTFNVLRRNVEDINARAGIPVEIAQVGARRDRDDCDTAGVAVTRDIFDVANNPAVDVVVEMIGGTTTAHELVMKAIANGKHVVTANKALIALHGNEIFAAAEQQGVAVHYEAAVAGGIPIIQTMREGLVANRIEWLAGIINGTGNFILTEMFDKGVDFSTVLTQAQELGYAEADPTFDVEGIDAAHKLTILASLAFGIPLQFDKVYTEGISRIEPQDVVYAKELGYRIKHLGIARKTDAGVELRVHPALVSERRLLANVDGVMNAVMVQGDAVGPTLYYGAGAGAEPTASAVISDIVDLARTLSMAPEFRTGHLGYNASYPNPPAVLDIGDSVCASYLRLMVQDHPGALAKITAIMADNGLDIESLIQKEHENGEALVPVVLLVGAARESIVLNAIAQVEALQEVQDQVTRIRMEALQ
ncbi:MAG: homoserine dehydrogenase [Porticoccaceae bacterium]|nr:homoserine dehydrogenase [Porticoccaceae bacterium]